MATEQEHGQDERIPQPGDPDFKPMPHADDDELVEARKAAETDAAKPAEGEGEGTGTGEGAGEGGEPPAAVKPGGDKPQGDPAGDGKGAKPPMIPKPRFDAAVHAAYWRGRAESAEALARDRSAGDQPAGEKQPTPQEQITALDRETDDAAKKYDEGTISFAQYKQVERTNERKIAELSRPAEAEPAPAAAREDLYLAERTDNLPQEFPILAKLTAADVEPLVPLAYRAAARDGVEITPDGRGDYLLRRYVAQQATKLYGDGAQAPKPSNQQQTVVNPPQAGRKKADLAERMPPDLNQLGGRSTVADPMAPERIKDMDVDDVAALPDSARRKIAGY